MKQVRALFCFTAALILLASCKKNNDQNISVSGQEFQSGTIIKSGDTLNNASSTPVKGTLQAGQTYYLSSNYPDAVINQGDTLTIQSGVKVLIAGPTIGANALGTQNHSPGIVVNGYLYSLGTKSAPVSFTLDNAALKSDPTKDPQDPNSDPAFKGWWGGIQGGTSSGDIVLKWTHVEYVGGIGPTNAPLRAGAERYGVYFGNPNANFVVEDCWLYGSSNDFLRALGGNYEILRNTFEKVGLAAGEGVNIKSGIGDVAYNVTVGGTGNAYKIANVSGPTQQGTMACYNNTVVTTGYRQQKAGEGGSIDFDSDGRGLAYNNLIVNCAYGFSVLAGIPGTPSADTANINYGYTYNYGDNQTITQQFLPTGFLTTAQTGDINAGNSTTPGANNPQFVSYTLPLANSTSAALIMADFVGSSNFRLQASSPAVGKGYTAFKPYAPVKVDKTFGATEITLPGKDMGAYQTDGTGNQH